MYEKRPTKETYICETKLLNQTCGHGKRPLKETYAYEKRPTREKRPMVFEQEPYGKISANVNIKCHKNLFKKIGLHLLYPRQNIKRPAYMERDL